MIHLRATFHTRQPQIVVLALSLLVAAAGVPASALGAHTVSGAMTDREGQPLPPTALIALDETGREVATGTTGADGRFCIDDDALAVGTSYLICTSDPTLESEQCRAAVASEMDCETALAALAPGGAAAGAGATAGALSTAEWVGIGLGAAGAAVGAGFGIEDAADSKPDEPAASPAR